MTCRTWPDACSFEFSNRKTRGTNKMKIHQYMNSIVESGIKALMRVSLILVAGLSFPALGQEENLTALEMQPALDETELHRIQGQGARFQLPALYPVHIILWDESDRGAGKPQRNGNITVQVTIGNKS